MTAALAHEVEQMKAQQAVKKLDGDEGRTMTRLVAEQAGPPAGQPRAPAAPGTSYLQFYSARRLPVTYTRSY